MKPEHHAWFSLLTLTAALSLCAAPGGATGYGGPALRFEENVGQTNAEVAYLVRGARHRVFLTRDAATLDLDGAARNGGAARAAVRMRVVGARQDVRPRGEGRLASSTRYLLAGREELRAPHFDRVRYAGVLPGVDLVFYGDPQRLEYDFVVQPGVAPEAIALEFEGTARIEVAASGDLALATAAGEVRLKAPFAYQIVDGRRLPVEARYELLAENRVAFRLGGYDQTRELVIDPVLVYAGYLGGAGADMYTAIKVNDQGEAFVVGATRSLDFPATAGAVQTSPAGGRCGGSIVGQTCLDVFAAKISADGSRVLWATYYGGTGEDRPSDAALGPDGSLYIVGTTASENFPVSAGAAQSGSLDGARPVADAFVLRIGPQGARVFGTRLGGSRADNGVGIAVDAAGAAHIVGHTFSSDMPFPVLTGNGRSGPADRTDAFVATVASDGGAVTFGAYLGGALDERAGDIAVLADGRLAVTGSTGSPDFPVTRGAFQPALAGGVQADAFLSIYRSGNLEHSSYFGGSGADMGEHLEADATGALVMIGSTESRDFPTAAGPMILWKRSLGFIARFPLIGARPQVSSYLVGTADELAVGSDGAMYVSGVTASSSPIFGGGSAPGCEGSLLRKILPTGRMAFSGLIAGLGALDVGSDGAVYSAATDVSGGLPATRGAFDSDHAGQSDVYVSKIKLEEQQAISLTCVENGASMTPGEVSPGEIVSLFGAGLGPDIPELLAIENGVVRSKVAGVRVLFNGTPAPLLFVWFNQINAVVPYAVAGAETVRIEVERDGRVSNSLDLPVAAAHPGLFTRDATGQGLAALFNEDGTKNHADNPAKAGSIIQLYGTGEGQTAPAGVDGLVAPQTLASLPKPLQDVTVKIGAMDAEVTYAGAAPGLVSGVLQVNVRIPPGTPSGEAAVQVTIGGKLNRQAVTVAVD